MRKRRRTRNKCTKGAKRAITSQQAIPQIIHPTIGEERKKKDHCGLAPLRCARTLQVASTQASKQASKKGKGRRRRIRGVRGRRRKKGTEGAKRPLTFRPSIKIFIQPSKKEDEEEERQRTRSRSLRPHAPSSRQACKQTSKKKY